MDPDYKKFGRGPRELTGAADLISQYKLLPHHDFFCKRSLPLSISDTHYLHNVVGDTEIRKGEGMQLGQLMQDTSLPIESNARIRPFDLDILTEAFQLRETAPVDLPPSAMGAPTLAGKSRSESKDKEKKHKRHKDKDKDKEHKKHKHRHKDRSKDKDKEKKKDKSGRHGYGNDISERHHEKIWVWSRILIVRPSRVPRPMEEDDVNGIARTPYASRWYRPASVSHNIRAIRDGHKRKHDGDEDANEIHKHKKSKHKSSKIDEMGAIRVAG